MMLLKWSNRHAYWQLMRADKPIGIYLLLWPTIWALLLAGDGFPPMDITAVFVFGVIIMRSAGCVINDFADRKVDGGVSRTHQRPLVSGAVTESEAIQLFCALVFCALGLVLLLNWQTIVLSLVALFLASIYPFMKRYTHLPQVFLGAAFSWSIPMAFSAIQMTVPNWVWLLFVANLLWTVAYDTQYAMVDRDDDIKVGIKSTAILFGKFDLLIISILQAGFISIMVHIGKAEQLNLFYFISLLLVVVLFLRQAVKTRRRDKNECFNAFLNNHLVGLVLAFGLAASYWSP